MKHHPLAAIFPMMSEPELDLLAEDIKENGQREKIILLDGMILDGRNRHRACELAKVKPLTENYREKGITPIEYVMSKNLHRRHLNTSQRAVSAYLYKVEIQKTEGYHHDYKEEKRVKGRGWALEKARKAFNLGISSVERANVIGKKRPELLSDVLTGKRSMHDAYRETMGKQNTRIKKDKTYEPPTAVLTNSDGLSVIHNMGKMGWDFEMRRSRSGFWKAHFYGKDGSAAWIVWSEKQTYPSFHTAVCAAAQEVSVLKEVAA